MRIGLLEIAIIIVVVVVIALVAGMRGRGEAKKATKSIPSAGRHKVKLAGAVIFLVGLLLLSAAVSLFRYLIWSYMWASVLLVIGAVLYLLARRR
ncbi:MAG: hypothetical protein A2147_02300 [Chloroflexi bacterium RBG_16_57_8]|nr:MAG: hypothetical protein A2147_02300 [Chloroflexi bacterium RBG_16_57_8]